MNVVFVYQKQQFLRSVYRNGYFPLHYREISAYFGVDEPIWLEYNGLPLRWNVPVGVLEDLLRRDSEAPWVIDVKSDPLPLDVIPYHFSTDDNRPDYMRALHEVVINHIKQSCFTLNGSAKKIMSLSETDLDQLWSAIASHNLGEYQEIMEKILPRETKRIPMKIYLGGTTTVVSAATEPEDHANFGAWLRALVPLATDMRVLIILHGIECSALAGKPIEEVWRQFRYLDSFLYVVVAPRHPSIT